jgi:TonB family protein
MGDVCEFADLKRIHPQANQLAQYHQFIQPNLRAWLWVSLFIHFLVLWYPSASEVPRPASRKEPLPLIVSMVDVSGETSVLKSISAESAATAKRPISPPRGSPPRESKALSSRTPDGPAHNSASQNLRTTAQEFASTRVPTIHTESHEVRATDSVVPPSSSQQAGNQAFGSSNNTESSKKVSRGEISTDLQRGTSGKRTLPSVGAAYSASNPRPEYPAISRRLGEQGVVVLRVLVSAQGSAQSVEIKSSSGSPTLDRAAVAAISRWRFSPATVDGVATTEWYETRWVFKLEN